MSALIAALRNQRQLDEDGCEVGISRQAADEAANVIQGLAVMVMRLARRLEKLGKDPIVPQAFGYLKKLNLPVTTPLRARASEEKASSESADAYVLNIDGLEKLLNKEPDATVWILPDGTIAVEDK